jgi:hypothetical protein
MVATLWKLIGKPSFQQVTYPLPSGTLRTPQLPEFDPSRPLAIALSSSSLVHEWAVRRLVEHPPWLSG